MFKKQARNRQFIYTIIASQPGVSLASLMHLAYLTDLRARKELGSQISNFCYKYYFGGPFSSGVHQTAAALIKKDYLKLVNRFYANHHYSALQVSHEEEFAGQEARFLDVAEIELLERSLAELKGCNAKKLAGLSQATRPAGRSAG